MNFWKAFEESLIVQGCLTLALTGAVIYLGVTGQEIPEILTVSFGTVIGYFFANKTHKVEQIRAERMASIQKGTEV